MRFETESLNRQFSKEVSTTKEDLTCFADKAFSSIDLEHNNEVFYINSRSARWLLHNLRHTALTEKQASKVRRLSRIYCYTGSSKTWTGKTVKINLDTLTIEDGLIRLYAIAMNNSYRNISLPIDFIGDVYE